jgi:hypothetical protein
MNISFSELSLKSCLDENEINGQVNIKQKKIKIFQK